MKFPFGPITFLVLILFATAVTSIAQKSDISERDFLTVTNAEAYRATAARYPRKETQTYEQLSDGKITYSDTEITEFVAIDKYRVKKLIVSKGKTATSGEIQVGKIRYCKEDSSEWEINCPEPPPAPAMGPINGAQYSLEMGADTKTYQRIYQSTREDNEKSTRISLTTIDRVILNIDSSHRERSIITTNSETKEIVSRFTEKLEYGIKLDPIEAPIKDNLDVVGQERAIDRGQYFAAYDAANSKSENYYPRKETIVNERFEDNRSVSIRTDTYQYATPDSSIQTVEITEKGKRSVNRYLRIGDVYYCQVGAIQFKKSKTPCEPVTMGMSPDPDTQKFSVTKIKMANEISTIYRMYTQRSYAPNAKDKPRVFSFEQIFSVRPDGRFASFDIKNGVESEPVEISSKTTIHYEYDVKIPKIEAPIK